MNNPHARSEIKAQMENLHLVDIWRELHPTERKFTWQKYNETKCARLDYFLISSSLTPYVQSAEMLPSFCSDHSGIVLKVDFQKFQRGRGFWKFNSSLLKDKNYVTIIKSTIKRVVAQYAIIDGDDNFFVNASPNILEKFYSESTPESLQLANLKINPQSFLDILLLEIRSESIKYASQRKRERLRNETKLMEDIKMAEELLQTANNEEDSHLAMTDLQKKKQELEQLIAHQAQGAWIRARSKYYIEGERPTKLFCSLERHNGVQKHIPKLIVEEDGRKVQLEDQKSIEEEVLKYYSHLFTSKPTEIDSVDTFLDGVSGANCPKLSSSQKEEMDGLLTTTELTKYLKKTKNNVALGSTGYTNEFYKFFWLDLKIFVTNALNYGYENGMLSVTQRLGIITLIPKGDKDKSFLKNWRPLTLLNSLYKLASGCIAESIKPHLDSIIHGHQKGFVAGRYIGEAVRTTYDLIHWAKVNHRTGILLLLDFEKAYDTLSFSYIKKCLDFFNFGKAS